MNSISETIKELFNDNIIMIDEIDNIVLNLSAGLLPEHLSQDEVQMLTSRYGVNWFEELGYTEPLYKKPTF
jgi:hypothetical protein